MTNILIPIVWLATAGLIMLAANPTITSHLNEIYSPFPDPADYPGVFGTPNLDYYIDWGGEVANKTSATGSIIGAFTVWPTFEIYGQTASPASFPPMALVQVVPLAWLGFAVWERLPFIGG